MDSSSVDSVHTGAKLGPTYRGVQSGYTRDQSRCKLPGTSVRRAANSDGNHQADKFVPNTDRGQHGPYWAHKTGNIRMAYGFFRCDFQGPTRGAIQSIVQARSRYLTGHRA